MDEILSLEDFVVGEAPSKVYYVPDFISEEDERFLLNKIYSSPKPKWTQLSGRRLQNWGGLPHPKGMVPEQLPEWLSRCTKKVASLDVFDGKEPNHVLVNEYEPGQGIMPHLDGPLFYPTITTISLGSHTVLNFYQPLKQDELCLEEKASDNKADDAASSCSLDNRYMMSFLLEPRSLVVFKEDMYTTFLHGIGERTEDIITDKIVNLAKCNQVRISDVLRRTKRISLTVRHVPKVLKMRLKLGK